MNNNTMEQENNLSNSYVRNLIKGITYRSVFFEVPLKDAQARLKSGLAFSYRERNGFLVVDYEYSGSLDNNSLQMSVTTHGSRSDTTFDITGELNPENSGTRLIMSVKNSALTILIPIMSIFMGTIVAIKSSHVLIGIVLGSIAWILLYLVADWHRNAAASKTSSYIWKIIQHPTHVANQASIT